MRPDDRGDDASVGVRRLAQLLRQGRAVCLTGAGISAESGVPTFRGKGGLWERYDPDTFAFPDGLNRLIREDPARLAAFLIDLYGILTAAQPNDAHKALAILEREQLLDAVITQNVDNLHQRGGARSVIELHGNAFRIRCARCATVRAYERDRLRELVRLLKRHCAEARQIRAIIARAFPRCACGGRFRSDVVLFSEMLPQGALEESMRRAQGCRVFLVIGTALAVYPAARLPQIARESGASLVEINRQETPFSRLCDLVLREDAGTALAGAVHTLGYA